MPETPGLVSYSYFSTAFTHSNGELVEEMRHVVAGVKYDTIIGTGLSGTVFTARVAPGLKKVFAILRKEDDTSTHSGNKLEGRVGKSWVFADDFSETGATLARVVKYMQRNHPECEFKGMYSYERGTFCTPEDLQEKFYYNSKLVDLLRGPVLGPRKAKMYEYPLTQPKGGWAPEMKALIKPPLDTEVSWDNSKGQPTFYSMSQNMVYDPEEFPQFKPLAEVVLKARKEGYSEYYSRTYRWSDQGRKVSALSRAMATGKRVQDPEYPTVGYQPVGYLEDLLPASQRFIGRMEFAKIPETQTVRSLFNGVDPQ